MRALARRALGSGPLASVSYVLANIWLARALASINNKLDLQSEEFQDAHRRRHVGPKPASRRWTASAVDADSESSSPPCRNAATAAPGEKVASLESADESVRAYDEDEIVHTVPCSCFAWSRERVRLCLCGCTSASIVLVVRLLLDWYSGQPTSYIALLFFST